MAHAALRPMLLTAFLLAAATSPVTAAPLTIDGETTLKYETIRYHRSDVADISDTERTLRLNFHQALSEQTEIFFRFGHQSYAGSATKENNSGLDQYGLLVNNKDMLFKIGSQDTYLGAYGAMFDNSSNAGFGMFKGIDWRTTTGRIQYHATFGKLDSALFSDSANHTISGGEIAYFAGSTRFMASALHIPHLEKATTFTGFSVNSPHGKAEYLAEYVRSSAPDQNQGILVGINYQPTEYQAIKILGGEIQDKAVPEGKASLGGYDNSLRGFQIAFIQALTPQDRLSLKYTVAQTITFDIPIHKTEIEYTHTF
ncbi:MAG: hypothetical protein E6713_08745 [Sporomusaceae bacterium]|nr:hypothetical protein [Sporomusaceae bacterium]